MQLNRWTHFQRSNGQQSLRKQATSGAMTNHAEHRTITRHGKRHFYTIYASLNGWQHLLTTSELQEIFKTLFNTQNSKTWMTSCSKQQCSNWFATLWKTAKLNKLSTSSQLNNTTHSKKLLTAYPTHKSIEPAFTNIQQQHASIFEQAKMKEHESKSSTITNI